jgi:AcrR family transcriptional regulator
MRKPMHEVSMREIIAEIGFSQGNIYRYYSNIDEILIELINRESTPYDVKAEVDILMIQSIETEKIIGKFFEIWGKAVLDNVIGVGKIFFEMNIVYTNDQKRLNNFLSKCNIAVTEAYLKEKGIAFVGQKISEGYFSPKLPFEDILALMITSFSGALSALIKHTHYKITYPDTLEKDRLLRSICTAIVLLLGGNEKLIYGED